MEASEKAKIIQDFKINEKDSGSSSVQVALLTHRIKYLGTHLSANKHDYQAKRRLQCLIGQRRHLLNYLGRKDINRYRDLTQRLNLRK